MAHSFRQDDYGSILMITIREDEQVRDLSDVLSMTLTINKPDGTALVRTPEFVTDGVDGRIRYVFVEGELEQTGRWPFQVHVVFAEGSWNSSVGWFTVTANL